MIQDECDFPPEMVLFQMIHGLAVSQLLYVAAKLKIADLLKDGPKSSAEIAKLTKTHPEALYRVMRALASFGIFTELKEKERFFDLSPLSMPLRTDVPNSMHAWAIMAGVGEDWIGKGWRDILYSVETSKPAFNKVFGMGTFEYFSQNPESGAVFYEAMTNLTKQVSAAVLDRYDFSEYKKVVDVGSGHGFLTTSILEKYPQIQGCLFDLPSVIEVAENAIQDLNVKNRCDFTTGNFFNSVIGGGDVYLLKHIIHDWGDEDAVKILGNCRHAMMAEKSKLLIIEHVILEGDKSPMGKILDVHMLVFEGGHERTENQFRTILEASGFKLDRVISTQSPVSIIEASPNIEVN